MRKALGHLLMAVVDLFDYAARRVLRIEPAVPLTHADGFALNLDHPEVAKAVMSKIRQGHR